MRWCAGGLAGLAALLLAGMIVPVWPVASESGEPGEAGEAQHRILLVASAIHTDIALPATPEMRRSFGFLAEAGLPIGRTDVAHIVVGWGGRSFYLETPTLADIRLQPLVRSLTLDRSVVHVELTGAIDPAADGVVALDIGNGELMALAGFVEASLARGADGAPIAISGAGYGAFDRFFEGTSAFNALAGCNVWTARALGAAGISAGLWTPLPMMLFWSLDLHG